MANVPSFTSPSFNAPTTAANTFDNLRGFSWKGVSFPSSSFSIQISQDLAELKYVEKDGAEMQPTGRNPIEFTARILFLNNITPGPTETWPQGDLYPNQWRKFTAACMDRTKGVLQHPELGPYTCVLRHAKTDWTAQTRDGVPVDVAWVETFDASNDLSKVLAILDPVSEALTAAQKLDGIIPSLNLPTLPAYQPTFTDLVRSIQGVFDSASLISARVAGTINQIGYRANAILDAINRASTSQAMAVESVKNGPARDAIDRLRAAAINLDKSLRTTGRKIGLYIPQDVTTFPMLCAPVPIGLNAKVGDLIALNPQLCRSALIPPMSRVRYYLDA